MKKIPDKIQNLYATYLKQHENASKEIPFYLKWLRYYLDFCHKYSHTVSAPNSLAHFILKLKQKNQQSNRLHRQNKQSLFSIRLSNPIKAIRLKRLFKERTPLRLWRMIQLQRLIFQKIEVGKTIFKCSRMRSS